jgi:hypothetical protein
MAFELLNKKALLTYKDKVILRGSSSFYFPPAVLKEFDAQKQKSCNIYVDRDRTSPTFGQVAIHFLPYFNRGEGSRKLCVEGNAKIISAAAILKAFNLEIPSRARNEFTPHKSPDGWLIIDLLNDSVPKREEKSAFDIDDHFDDEEQESEEPVVRRRKKKIKVTKGKAY